VNSPVEWYTTVDTAPTKQPVTTAEAKAQCRITTSDEDTQFDAWIAAARDLVEGWTGRTFYQTTRKLHLDCFPGRGVLLIPYSPLLAVSSISYVDTDGNSQTLSSDDYVVDAAAIPGRVVLSSGSSWPSIQDRPAAVTITYSCGYTTDAAGIARLNCERAKGRQAVLLLVAEWYRVREASIVGAAPVQHAFSVDALIASEAINPALFERMQ